ncbi:MAG: hypothetical protein NTV77_00590 [Candidatus Azambacteria bacterium]|nr:hypothetical protein [Candidatus Azambacteria bacterium]
MKPFIIKADFERDLQNWIQAIRKGQSHGLGWIKYAPSEVRAQIEGKNPEEIGEILRLFLEKKYITEKKQLIDYAANLEMALNNVSDKMFSTLERITEQPMYRDNFSGFITTFPRAPYFTASGYIWFIYGKNNEWQIMSCMHELFHMQFESYYKNRLEKQISNEQFAFLREAMTVILNEESHEITSEIDEGYPIHQEFRTYLLTLWKQKKNFEEFIENAIKSLKKFNPQNS